MSDMAFFRKSDRHGDSTAEGVKSLEEPMEATLADNGGMARITFSFTGSREAAGKWLTGTVEFVGFGIQVFLEDPMFSFEAMRELGQKMWQVADAQEGEMSAVFEPHLKMFMKAPSKKSARLDVELEFKMGTDADVDINLQTDHTLALSFVEAMERALEAIDDLP